MSEEEPRVTYSRDFVEAITLRDYFAAKAMAALCRQDGPFSAREPIPLAQRAYQMADAMLAEREK